MAKSRFHALPTSRKFVPGAKPGHAARNVLLVASAVSVIVGLYHIIGGTPEVMHPVYSANLPPESASVLDVLWYQMAALMAGATMATLVAAFRSAWRPPVAWIIGGHFLVISAICLFHSLVWFGNPWGLIHWAVFGPVGLITFWAARRPNER